MQPLPRYPEEPWKSPSPLVGDGYFRLADPEDRLSRDHYTLSSGEKRGLDNGEWLLMRSSAVPKELSWRLLYWYNRCS